jgi:hypothetical protein
LKGNNGWAGLFNDNGRKKRNSFVTIVQGGPERVWVHWDYFCVNEDDDSYPALRGIEDYITCQRLGMATAHLLYDDGRQVGKL